MKLPRVAISHSSQAHALSYGLSARGGIVGVDQDHYASGVVGMRCLTEIRRLTASSLCMAGKAAMKAGEYVSAKSD